MTHKLIIIAGATASGKTSEAIRLAQHYNTEIVSCDSRQCYKELSIGVARPSKEELETIKHHFIACRSVCNPYNIYDYEHDAIKVINTLFETHDIVIGAGGSGLYIDAVCHGIAKMPDPRRGLREELKEMLRKDGIEKMQTMLQQIDPEYYDKVDRYNPARLQRALEVCITTGKTYSSILAEQEHAERPFDIELRILQHDTATLRNRINQRVDTMIKQGLADEVASVWHMQHLNTLQTVGYREFFGYENIDMAKDDLSSITTQIKLNTWHYAKKQITWFKRQAISKGITIIRQDI